MCLYILGGGGGGARRSGPGAVGPGPGARARGPGARVRCLKPPIWEPESEVLWDHCPMLNSDIASPQNKKKQKNANNNSEKLFIISLLQLLLGFFAFGTFQK